MKKRNLIIAISLIFIGLVIGFILSSKLGVQKLNFAKETGVSRSATEFLGKFSESLSEVAEAVEPSVVNISTTMTVVREGIPFNDPFFRKFFGEGFGLPKKFKTSSLGSGVIVTKDGYILTNNHVVKDAEEIKVILYDKREFKGKVIGADPKTDLAVIKIEIGRASCRERV